MEDNLKKSPHNNLNQKENINICNKPQRRQDNKPIRSNNIALSTHLNVVKMICEYLA